MAAYNDVTFDALCGHDRQGSLVYLVGAVKRDYSISLSPEEMRDVLVTQFDVDENVADTQELKERDRFLPNGVKLLTPIIATTQWSPVHYLANMATPERVAREPGNSAAALGVWNLNLIKDRYIDWDHLGLQETFLLTIIVLAKQRHDWRDDFLLVAACPGWDYVSSIGTLDSWDNEEIEQSGRLIWQRTADG